MDREAANSLFPEPPSNERRHRPASSKAVANVDLRSVYYLRDGGDHQRATRHEIGWPMICISRPLFGGLAGSGSLINASNVVQDSSKHYYYKVQ